MEAFKVKQKLFGADKVKLPKCFQNPPKLDPALVFYFNAFMDLNTCRNNAMSLGPIPWLAIKDYASFYNLANSGEEGVGITPFDVFYSIIRALDDAFLEFHRKEAENKHGTVAD